MERKLTMERYEEIERSIITSYRKKIWTKFIKGINEYDMIQDGDKIAVCMSGGKDSMLMAKCFQELQRHGKMNFEVVFLVMNPGYNEINKQKIISNAKLLNIPITMFETNIFDAVAKIDDHPCYVCARMRRGYLYNKAKELGCNKIALGHHFDDVIETILMGMLYGAQMQTMMPKLHSTFHPGMELIRPLYFVKEADIISWKEKNDLEFIQCACRFTEHCTMCDNGGGGSKREEMKKLIKKLRQQYKNVDMNIFRSAQNVNLDTLISYRKDGKTYDFLDNYKEKGKNTI
jgi:tRNA(Ile)-lysidine synthase TilS/MesJ